MAVINLSEIDEKRIEELAAKATLKGVLLEYLGATPFLGHIYHEYLVTSVSDPTRFHDVQIVDREGKWLAECDKGIEDGCEANRLGNHLCGHVAAAVIALRKELGNGAQDNKH